MIFMSAAIRTCAVRLAAGALMAAPLATTQAGAQERLLFTSLSPAGSANSALFNAWAKRVNEASKGALQIEVRDGVTLANFGNVYDRVQDDVVQIGWAIHQAIGGKFPLSEVAGLPFVSSGGPEGSSALWKLNRSGVLDAEYKDVVPLIFAVLGPAQIHFGKPQPARDDLAGLKIGVIGRVPSQLIAELKGTPNAIPPEQMYEALQRGTIDAAMISWAGFAPYKLHEVTAHHVEGPLGQSTSMFFMSRKRYDALSPAARNALAAVADDEAATKQFAQHFNKQWLDGEAPAVSDPKHKVVKLGAEQLANWRAKAAPVLAEWTKSRANGGKALEAFKEFYAGDKK